MLSSPAWGKNFLGPNPGLSAMAVIALSLACCSTVGPGFANHPIDCAMGIRWADCLPGTPGYNNGGGAQTRALETGQDNQSIQNQISSLGDQCANAMAAPELDPIRHKVELWKTRFDTPPPFEMASNDNFPSESEKPTIAKWATLRDQCIQRDDAISIVPPSASALQANFIQENRSFFTEAQGKIDGLVVALYQAKLTYGEFAEKRYEIGRDAAEAALQYRQAALLADQERQVQAQQLAQQQFQNRLIAWSVYMQSVNARQPQTVRLEGDVGLKANCTSSQLGTSVQTSCY